MRIITRAVLKCLHKHSKFRETDRQATATPRPKCVITDWMMSLHHIDVTCLFRFWTESTDPDGQPRRLLTRHAHGPASERYKGGDERGNSLLFFSHLSPLQLLSTKLSHLQTCLPLPGLFSHHLTLAQFILDLQIFYSKVSGQAHSVKGNTVEAVSTMYLSSPNPALISTFRLVTSPGPNPGPSLAERNTPKVRLKPSTSFLSFLYMSHSLTMFSQSRRSKELDSRGCRCYDRLQGFCSRRYYR
jgi:hypothetical protein